MNRMLVVTTVTDTHKAFLTPFAKHFRDRGWQVDGMSLNLSKDAECLEIYDQVWDVDFARNPFSFENIFVAPKQIQKILSQQDYDIIHLHTAVASFVTRTALKGLRRKSKSKIIYTIHGFNFYRGGNPLTNTAFLFLEKLVKSETDYAIVINREDEETAKQYQLLPSDRIRYMPGIGLDIKHYSRDRVSKTEVEQVRQNLGLKPDNPLFLSVAELIPRKRPLDILEAFAHLNSSEAHLAFVGSGPLMNQIKQLARELGVENRIHCLGFRKDIPALICTSVATILASRQEGLPRCVMESLSLETPVIGSDIRGTRDLLKDGHGLLVNGGDINELERAMAWILEHPDEARRMGKRGQESIEKYDLQHIIKLHEALYDEAIGLEAPMTTPIHS